MVQGIVIPAETGKPLEQRDFVRLKDYQAAVGGWVEPVDLSNLGVTIYVNGEGLLRHLPFNSRASFLWWYHVPLSRRGSMLVGDALIVGLPDEDGADTDVPTAARELLLAETRFRVEVRLIGDHQWRLGLPLLLDFWEAIMWAMLLLEQIPGAEDSRVVSVEPHEGATAAA